VVVHGDWLATLTGKRLVALGDYGFPVQRAERLVALARQGPVHECHARRGRRDLAAVFEFVANPNRRVQFVPLTIGCAVHSQQITGNIPILVPIVSSMADERTNSVIIFFEVWFSM
jgi:hypothetical protein